METRNIINNIGYRNMPAYYFGRIAHANETAWRTFNKTAELLNGTGLIAKNREGLVRKLILKNPVSSEQELIKNIKFSAGSTIAAVIGTSYILGSLFNRHFLNLIYNPPFKVNSFLAEHSGNSGLIILASTSGWVLDKLTHNARNTFCKSSLLLSATYLTLGEILPIIPGNAIMDAKDIPLTILTAFGLYWAYKYDPDNRG
ncbi:MAG: hypothetical protein NT030_00165 [Candidatus Saganbacteria bacterium]|nr:hypothetical protein [Candidatus Saganbacteria bacterium]